MHSLWGHTTIFFSHYLALEDKFKYPVVFIFYFHHIVDTINSLDNIYSLLVSYIGTPIRFRRTAFPVKTLILPVQIPLCLEVALCLKYGQ